MNLNGTNFNVEVNIDVDDGIGEGIPMVWGHGLMSSMASEDLLQLYDWELFPKSNMLIRYDARGHGKTDPSFIPMDYHWKNLSRDMISVVDQYHSGSFIAGGQSMGCATSIYTAIQAPDRVKGLVLMNPPTAWEERASQAGLYRKMSNLGMLFGGGMLAATMSNKLDRLFPSWLVNANEVNAAGALDGLKALKRMSLYNLFKGAALTDLPSKSQLQSIDVPTLILAWGDDPSHPLSVAEELHSLLQHTELIEANSYSDVKTWPTLIREFVSSVNESR